MTTWQVLQSFWPHMLAGLTVLATLGDAFQGFKLFKGTVNKMFSRMFSNPAVKAQIALIASNQTIMGKQMQLIADQLKPNGGSSLRDVVDGINKRQMLHDERLKAMSEDAPQCIQEFNAEGELVWCNRTYLRMVNRDFTEVSGYGWTNTIAPEDRDRVKDEWQEALQQERDYEADYRVCTSKGTVLTVSVKATAMRSPTAVIGYVSTLMQKGS